LAEWLYEAGIGECRAALVDAGTILQAAIELDDGAPRAGAVLSARLGIPMPPAGARARLESGGEAIVDRVPPGLSEGAALLVEVIREAIPEAGATKLARVRVAAPGVAEAAGPSLTDRIAASGIRVRAVPRAGPDLLEAAGWSELLEEATGGTIAFAGGRLRLSITPAMTLFDVDGTLPPAQLAIAGAAAAGRAIRRFDIGGSIGIDLPTVAGRAERQAAAAALDEVLPQPFERTAVNGFGFLQIVRRRTRASLPELLRADPAGAAARALLRRAERSTGAGTRTLAASPQVMERIAARADWIARLEAALGARIGLRTEPSLPISAGHVAVEHP